MFFLFTYFLFIIIDSKKESMVTVIPLTVPEVPSPTLIFRYVNWIFQCNYLSSQDK